jgi:hypothetical protein
LDNRIVSANTHFEEWWFKTFLLGTAMAAYIFNIETGLASRPVFWFFQ